MRQVLKYPGSKWNLARELVKLIPEHHTTDRGGDMNGSGIV